MVNLFKQLGMDPNYRFSHEIIATVARQFPKLLILEAFATNEGYLVLEKNLSDKNKFLKIFGGGNHFSSVKGAKPWKRKGNPRNIAAEFYADLGRGENGRVYFDKGWMAWFPEGYSTMTLVEFYEEPKDAGQFRIEGRVYHGEKAFARLQVLEVDDELGSPDSINRWEI